MGINEFNHFIIDAKVDGKIDVFDIQQVMEEFQAYALKPVSIGMRNRKYAAACSGLFRDDVPLGLHRWRPFEECPQKDRFQAPWLEMHGAGAYFTCDYIGVENSDGR
jgi:hypothetical protein